MSLKEKKIVPLILAGGSGSRLWPASRNSFPKQFQSLYSEKSLFQETLLRLRGLDTSEPIVVVNQEHTFIAQEQLNELNLKGKILIEPESRNTAPAVCLGAHYSNLTSQKDNLLLILAADHLIEDEKKFKDTVTEAISLARTGKIITFGVIPTSANTGYGYIEKGEKITNTNAFSVEEFVEKPNKELAKIYLDSKNYLWNSGMFLSKTSTLLEELELFCSDTYGVTKASLSLAKLDEQPISVDSAKFSTCRNESLDIAVMEKTDKLCVLPLELSWNDLGSWNSLWHVTEKDTDGNVLKGDIHLHDSQDCYVSSNQRFVSIVGLKDITVIDTKDALLVSAKDRSEDIKKSVEHLKSNNKDEWDQHTTVYRPWGKFESIEKGETFQVKKITVKPKERLSLQMHNHRAEHWIVVSGSAKVTCAEEEFNLNSNESTFIPKGSKHRLENILDIPLVLIEVQSGDYLGEDDIVRFEDNYGRE